MWTVAPGAENLPGHTKLAFVLDKVAAGTAGLPQSCWGLLEVRCSSLAFAADGTTLLEDCLATFDRDAHVPHPHEQRKDFPRWLVEGVTIGKLRHSLSREWFPQILELPYVPDSVVVRTLLFYSKRFAHPAGPFAPSASHLVLSCLVT